METHAHDLHKAPGHGWKHYFFEFFMLFLAVSLGFYMENLREQYVEKERGAQYLFSFYEDLKKDTIIFSNLIKYNKDKIEGLDGMFECYNAILKDWESNSCMIELIRNSSSNHGINFSDGTMLQLKNAGGFRLLDKVDRDSIISYDKATRAYENFQTTALQQSQDNIRNTISMLGDFNANKFLFKGVAGVDSTNVVGQILFSNDKVLLNKYFNDLFRYRQFTKGQLNIAIALTEKATKIIEYFNVKYHFE